MKTKLLMGCIAIVVMLSATPSMAATDAETAATIDALQSRIERLEAEKADVVHKEEMAKLMKEVLDDAQMAPAMPTWLKDLTFFGDFRLRMLAKKSRAGKTSWLNGLAAINPNLAATVQTLGNAAGIMPNNKTKTYMEGRLRFGFEKKWWDGQLSVLFRLSTGNFMNTGGSGTYYDGFAAKDGNNAFGDGFSKKFIFVDAMYAKYQPKWLKGLTIVAGKMDNQIRTRTFMTWDEDITPEGVYVSYVAPFCGDFKPYVEGSYYIMAVDVNRGLSTVAASILQGQYLLYQENTEEDVRMYQIGAGFDWKLAQDMNLFFGVSYYKIQNYDKLGVLGGSLGGIGLGFNTGDDFLWENPEMEFVELTAKFDWKMLNLPWQFWMSWAYNCAGNYGSNSKNTQMSNIFQAATGSPYVYDRNNKNGNGAIALGMKVGENKKKGDWSASYTYAYIEDQAVPAMLTDFYFGGPNQKGWILRGAYNVDDFLVMGMSFYLTDAVNSNWITDKSGYTSTLMLDMTWKF